MWGSVETAWNRDVINGNAHTRAEFFSYAVVSIIGLKGIDKVGKAGKVGSVASKVDNKIPYNAMQTDKLKDLVKSNVYTNMLQKADHTANLLKSNFSKEAINKSIQAAKNSQIITNARNTLDPSNIKEASKKIYEDAVKAPIAKTQNWMQNKKDQILDTPIPNLGPIPLGPTPNMTVRDSIDAAKDNMDKIVSDKDGERNSKDTIKDKGINNAEAILGEIDFSKLDNNGVIDLINDINKSILSEDDKIIANIAIYNNAIEAGVKVDIQVIASPEFIDSSGRIKWPDENGFTIDSVTGKAIKYEVIPKKGDIIDRYGSPNGTFTSPINNNTLIPYDQRSLPYLENKNVYHQYVVIRNFDELTEAIKNSKDKDLIEMINADALRYNINLDELKTYGGEIAPAFGAIGGGTQWQLPLSVDYLIKLGFLKENK